MKVCLEYIFFDCYREWLFMAGSLLHPTLRHDKKLFLCDKENIMSNQKTLLFKMTKKLYIFLDGQKIQFVLNENYELWGKEEKK